MAKEPKNQERFYQTATIPNSKCSNSRRDAAVQFIVR